MKIIIPHISNKNWPWEFFRDVVAVAAALIKISKRMKINFDW